MLQSKLKVTPVEAKLLDTIAEMQYGEIFGVEVPAGVPLIERDLSPQQLSLIEYLRSGCQSIDILTIHAGSPVMAENDRIIHGFRCRKKVRFPTVRTEG